MLLLLLVLLVAPCKLRQACPTAAQQRGVRVRPSELLLLLLLLRCLLLLLRYACCKRAYHRVYNAPAPVPPATVQVAQWLLRRAAGAHVLLVLLLLLLLMLLLLLKQLLLHAQH